MKTRRATKDHRGSMPRRSQLFRIWITRYDSWRPDSWRDAPPEAVAIQPAEPGCFTAREATRFIKGFNSAMLSRAQPVWAVAVPISVRYVGDLSPGEMFAAPQRFSPAPIRR